MSTNKHFTLSERIEIERYLNESYSFKAIGRKLNRDCTTISKDIKKHIYLKKTGAYGKPFNNCLKKFDCKHSYLCDSPTCKNNYCRFCSKCSSICKDFIEEKCIRLLKPPYVCNGCKELRNCRLEKSVYSATTAQKEYETLRCESRSGITINEEEAKRLDDFISPLIKRGQSIHHICSNNTDTIMCSEKTIYNYVNFNLFSARNIDLPRKVRYRSRKKSTDSFKINKSCRVGRTYEDFITYMNNNPDTPVVEMDSVEGVKGGKVLLTIHFKEAQFMIAFLRDANTSKSVIDIFENLYIELGNETFNKLFPVILTDNGSEFSNPSVIEFDCQGNRRTQIFYCNPSAPYQKGAIENNHELIRRIIAKGNSLNGYKQDDIILMMNHINSYGRKKLNNQSPHQVFSFFYGVDILKKLGAILIPPNEVILNPVLLKK
jgi:IS30 family transposase